MPILRAVAMTAVGNAALAGRDVAAFATSSLFQYSKQTEFVSPLGGDKYEQLAPDVLAWFAWLKADKCRGLRLHTAPMEQKPGRLGTIDERMLVGFVGGGPRWFIETAGEGASQLWEGFDRVADPKDPDHRIWRTAFVRIAETAPQENADADLKGAVADLESALTDILALARKFDSAPFDGIFEEALAELRGEQHADAGLDFFAQCDLTPEAQRLLLVSERAWVFGGMGSWNDTGPASELNAEHERTSEALFQALVRALTAVANSSFRDA